MNLNPDIFKAYDVRGIYPAQRILLAKAGFRLPRASSLRELHRHKTPSASDHDTSAAEPRDAPGDQASDSK